MLQYVEDDTHVMREMARLLRPGGSMVVTASAMNVLRGGHAGSWPEVRRYTRARMRRIAEDAGLRVVRTSYLFASLFPMMLAARIAQRAGGRQPDAAEDWEMRVPPAPINGVLTGLLSVEAALVRHVAMPMGSSVLVVATKPVGEESRLRRFAGPRSQGPLSLPSLGRVLPSSPAGPLEPQHAAEVWSLQRQRSLVVVDEVVNGHGAVAALDRQVPVEVYLTVDVEVVELSAEPAGAAGRGRGLPAIDLQGR